MITTRRLTLVPATPELVEDELAGGGRLADRLHAELPADWPPEYHDEAALGRTREALAEAGAAGWWLHYILWKEPPRLALVGVGGYKGPPQGGAVEIGYSVVPSWQRRGIATEAVSGLVAAARKRGADTVIAHTLPGLVPSIGVLEKLGFVPAESPAPGVIGFRLGEERL